MAENNPLNLKKNPSDGKTSAFALNKQGRFAGCPLWLKKYAKPLSVVIIAAVVLGGVLYFLNKSSKKDNQAEQPVSLAETAKPDKKTVSYSRVTFFLTAPVKGSLAIPETWEGRYRMEDGGSVINFKYIGNRQIKSDLFSVRTLTKEDWDASPEKQGTLIAEKDGYVFVYAKSGDNPYEGEESAKFLQMRAESDAIIKSFKSFKL